MKLKVLPLAFAAFAFALPGAAVAKSAHAGGHGGGKPSWAGGGGGSAHAAHPSASTSHSSAGPTAADHAARGVKRAAAAARAEAKRAEREMNPAWTCKTERAEDPAAFTSEYGANENKANAFGKCVSRIAQARHGKSGSHDSSGSTDSDSKSDGSESDMGTDVGALAALLRF